MYICYYKYRVIVFFVSRMSTNGFPKFPGRNCSDCGYNNREDRCHLNLEREQNETFIFSYCIICQQDSFLLAQMEYLCTGNLQTLEIRSRSLSLQKKIWIFVLKTANIRHDRNRWESNCQVKHIIHDMYTLNLK